MGNDYQVNSTSGKGSKSLYKNIRNLLKRKNSQSSETSTQEFDDVNFRKRSAENSTESILLEAKQKLNQPLKKDRQKKFKFFRRFSLKKNNNRFSFKGNFFSTNNSTAASSESSSVNELKVVRSRSTPGSSLDINQNSFPKRNTKINLKPVPKTGNTDVKMRPNTLRLENSKQRFSLQNDSSLFETNKLPVLNMPTNRSYTCAESPPRTEKPLLYLAFDDKALAASMHYVRKPTRIRTNPNVTPTQRHSLQLHEISTKTTPHACTNRLLAKKWVIGVIRR